MARRKTTKRKKTTKREKTTFSQAEMRKIRTAHGKRSAKAQGLDEVLKARQAETPEQWMREPDKFDVKGVDLPERRPSRPRPQSREQTPEKKAVPKIEKDRAVVVMKQSTPEKIPQVWIGKFDTVSVGDEKYTVEGTQRKGKIIVVKDKYGRTMKIKVSDITGHISRPFITHSRLSTSNTDVGGKTYTITTKTIDNPRNKFKPYDGEFHVIMRKGDSELFIIEDSVLKEQGINTTPGTAFNARTVYPNYPDKFDEQLLLSDLTEKV